MSLYQSALMPSAQPFRRSWALSIITVALESNKCIQCQQQPALLCCVTEMCPCGCVALESLQCWGVDMGGLPFLTKLGTEQPLVCPRSPALSQAGTPQYRTAFSVPHLCCGPASSCPQGSSAHLLWAMETCTLDWGEHMNTLVDVDL